MNSQSLSDRIRNNIKTKNKIDNEVSNESSNKTADKIVNEIIDKTGNETNNDAGNKYPQNHNNDILELDNKIDINNFDAKNAETNENEELNEKDSLSNKIKKDIIEHNQISPLQLANYKYNLIFEIPINKIKSEFANELNACINDKKLEIYNKDGVLMVRIPSDKIKEIISNRENTIQNMNIYIKENLQKIDEIKNKLIHTNREIDIQKKEIEELKKIQ